VDRLEVSECFLISQVEYVYEHELRDIKDKIERFYKNRKQPKFGFVILNKRTNARFMTKDGSNPSPGTIVSDVVTLPER
jgi:tRNA(Ser,Leu) C12 N-acetylase TAN1